VILESLFIPEPVISVAVEPKTKQDMDKLSKALQSCLKKIQPSASTLTLKPTKP